MFEGFCAAWHDLRTPLPNDPERGPIPSLMLRIERQKIKRHEFSPQDCKDGGLASANPLSGGICNPGSYFNSCEVSEKLEESA